MKTSLVVLLTLATCLIHAAAKVDNEASEEHEGLSHVSPRIVVTFSFAALALMIAAGGGIGGGGILVPLFIFGLGFFPKAAIPLSNATILGGSISNILLNMNKRHPLANRYLIDWDLIIVMEPVTIAGAVVGSFLNVLAPPWLLCLLLVGLLSGTAYRTLLKGIKRYKRESKELLLADMDMTPLKPSGSQSTLDVVAETTPGFETDAGYDRRLYDPTSKVAQSYEEEQNEQKNQEILENESKYSIAKIMVIFGVTMGVFMLNLAKGGHGLNPFQIKCASTSYWLLTSAVLPFVLLISYFARRHLLKLFHLKKAIGYKYVEGDVRWDERNTIVYPAICCVAGICAGLFGIGGGIVKGPLMLEMGVLPQSAAATSATMILFTSLSATVSYALFGVLNFQFAGVLFAIGIIFTAIGQLAVTHLVKKYGRSSYIILSIAIIIGFSAIGMGIESGASIVSLILGENIPVKSFCSTGRG